MADIPLFSGASAFQPASIDRLKIPVESLTLRAATQGAALGQAIPSTLGAIAQGISGGIEAYQSVRKNEAAIEAQQVLTQVNQEILEQKQLENQINELERENVIKAKRLEKENAVKKLEEEGRKLDATSELREKLASDNPDVLRETLDPKYQILGDEAQEIIFDKLSAADAWESEEQKLAYANQLQYTKNFKAQQEAQLAASKNLGSASKDVLKNPGFAKITAAVQAKLGEYVNVYNDSELFNFLNNVQAEPGIPGKYVAKRGDVTLAEDLDDQDIQAIQNFKNTFVSSNKIDPSIVKNIFAEREQKQALSQQKRAAEKAVKEKEEQGPSYFERLIKTGHPLLALSKELSPTQFQQAPAAVAPTPPEQVKQQQTQIAPTVNQDIVNQKKQEILNSIKESPVSQEKYKAAKERFKQKREAVEKAAPIAFQNRATENAIKNISFTMPEFSFVQEAFAEGLPEPEKQERIKNMGINPNIINNVNIEPLLSNQPAIIKALAAVESGGKRKAVSPTGVRGLLQVTRKTAAQYGLNRDVPEENVSAGIQEFSRNLRVLKSPMLAIAAYNVGIGTITDSIKRTKSLSWDIIKEDLKDVLPATQFKGVENYPEKVMLYTAAFTNLNNADDLYVASLSRV